MKTIFGISEKEAKNIRSATEKKFKEINYKIMTELKSQELKLDPATLKALAAGVAGSMAVLTLAEAAGFGLFLFATTTLHAIGLLFGITFAFETYTALTTILGVLTGPIGWISIPILVSGVVIARKYFSKPEYFPLKQTIIKCVLLRGDI